jgi:molybdopterin molybdotransferase
LHFWKLLLKPGMPALFGEIAGKPILALPGNPVSAYITFRALAWPAICALQGLPPPVPLRRRARLETALRKTHARAEHLRGVHRSDANGQLWVRPVLGQDSHRIVSLAEANVLLLLPEGALDWPVGTLVDIEPIALTEAAHGIA